VSGEGSLKRQNSDQGLGVHLEVFHRTSITNHARRNAD
jgi:hypothetical protein